jgi:hypothetical protein
MLLLIYSSGGYNPDSIQLPIGGLNTVDEIPFVRITLLAMSYKSVEDKSIFITVTSGGNSLFCYLEQPNQYHFKQKRSQPFSCLVRVSGGYRPDNVLFKKLNYDPTTYVFLAEER